MKHAMVERVETWLRGQALPFWAEHGLDRERGGPFETLTLKGQPSATPFKRARVSFRQIYVYSHAERLGWPGARAVADQVFAFAQQRFWQGLEAGWLRRVTPEGAPLDPTPDLYDYAFAVFALAWRFNATQDDTAKRLAFETLDIIERRFAHPGGEGFHNALPPTLPRQQNPHMHLLEAALAAAETFKSDRFAGLAQHLAALFKARLSAPDGVLREFFADDWGRAPGKEGRWVEPGHLYEWAWILAQHGRLFGVDHVAPVTGLVHWAERHGLDPRTGAVVNAVRDDGAVVLDGGARTWPTTERIKGWLALEELTGVDAGPALEQSLRFLFDRVFAAVPPGGWMDAFDAEGNPTTEVMPASTFYHVFLAFAELLRLRSPWR